jgi:hypothetical protein
MGKEYLISKEETSKIVKGIPHTFQLPSIADESLLSQISTVSS